MTSTLAFEETKFTDVWEDLMPMFLAHAQEVGTLNQCKEKNFCLSLETYFKLQKDNEHIAVIAKDGDEIVGYVSLVVTGSLHEFQKNVAITDAIYLKPGYRKGSNGISLIKATEKIIKENGSISYIQLAENYNYMIGPIFERLGYRVTDIIHTKSVEDIK